MKRLLSIVLALVMFAAVIPGFAADSEISFSDVAAGDYYAEAANALVKAEILTGYEDGTFRPDGNITRAEMAAIICRVIGKEEVGSVKTATDFDDVEESSWASGYIKVASDAGIINGDGNGSFRPDDDVTYEEAIKMVVCALGLADDITANPSDWSKPYIDVAKANGITASLKGSKGTASTRADVAVMTYNGICATIAAPVASVAAGSYTSTQSVTLTSATSGAVIYYTTDGSEPTTSSTKYTKAISILSTTTLKAVAVLDDVFAGDVMSVEYNVKLSSDGSGGGGGGGSSTTKYTVTFDLNYDGATDAPVSQSVKKNNYASEPDDPERDGYMFTGWYTEAECTTLYDFSAKVTRKLTLYAGWSDGSDNSFVVTFDLNYDGATDAPESQTVEKNGYVTVPDEPEREGYVFVGWYTDDSYTEIFDFSTAVTSAIVLYARWVDVTDTTDTDGDGLTDAMEEYFGTDATLYDTDGDGLSDYIELISNLNPLSVDTDGNGVEDGDEDSDGDGLTNLEEVDYETSLILSDTDSDGLDDYSEIYTYGTDPTLYDTDGDGVSDGIEITLGTDPLTAETSFELDLAYENEDDSVTPSVQIELSGEQVETLSIDKVDNEFLFPEEMPGYIGGAYDFSVDGEFDSAIISFEFDASLLNDSDFDPVIYYYDEEEGLLEALETTVEGNVASAEVTHFSTYILVNRVVFEESFTWRDIWESDVTYTSLEIVLVIDDSGSMGSQGANNDPENLRLSVSQDLVSGLPDGSAIGIVKFGEEITMLTESLIYDKDEAISYLNTDYFHSNEYYTYMYEAIEASFDLFESDEEDTLKIMVVLTDGSYNGSYMHSSVVATANENNVKIYTVGLGARNTSYFNNYLKPLSDETGGAFYLAEDASELSTIYEEIGDRIDIETDSDNDGIPDYYEENMVLFNGITIELDKNNPDTDGDGLLDGEEIVLVYTYNEDKTQVIVRGKVISNPTEEDSDRDGFNDYLDPTPMKPDVFDSMVSYTQYYYPGQTTVTICARQPKWDSRNCYTLDAGDWNPYYVSGGSGHSYLGINYSDGTQYYFGYYGDTNGASTAGTSSAQIEVALSRNEYPGYVQGELWNEETGTGNDEHNGLPIFTISKTFVIDSEDVKNINQYRIDHQNDSYVIDTNNCTTFAVKALKESGLNVEIYEHSYTWDTNVIVKLLAKTYYGYTPADTCQDIKANYNSYVACRVYELNDGSVDYGYEYISRGAGFSSGAGYGGGGGGGGAW